MHRTLYIALYRALQVLQVYNLTVSFYPLLLKYFLYITTLVTAPYLLPKCLLIVGFILAISSITLLLTLYWAAKELYIRPVTFIGLILFILFLLITFLTLYIGEKKGTVLTTIFSGPFAAYKLNYSRYCGRYCLRRCYWFYYYRPPYRGAARSWPYYHHPLYYGAARSRSYGRRL